MPHLTFAELISRQVPITASEAAALTLAVARELDEERAVGHSAQLPAEGWIILSSTGQVSLLDVGFEPLSRLDVDRSTYTEETAGLATLLRRLLRLDDRGPASRRESIPGALLVLLARNLGQIDLPPATRDEFVESLGRFATADTTRLAAVFWRAARFTPDVVQPRAAAMAPTPDRRSTKDERRHQGPSRAELRRALRDVERQLYEVRNAEPVAADAVSAARAAPALARGTSAMTVPFAAVLLIAALVVSGTLGGVRDAAATATIESVPPVQVAEREARAEIAQAGEPAAKVRGDLVAADVTQPLSPGSAKGHAAMSARAKGDARSAAAVRVSRQTPPAKPRRPAGSVVSFPGGTRPFPFTVSGG